MSGLAVGAVLITALVVARQVLAVRENVRLLAETAARQNEVRFRSLVQHSSDVIIVVRPDGAIRFVSPSVRGCLATSRMRSPGARSLDLLHPDDRDRARTFCRRGGAARRASRPPSSGASASRTAPSLHAEIIATNLLDEPAVRGIVLNTRDVSERKRLEQQLLHQAFHDPLTGLANRALFRDRVSHALTLARRHGHAITVLFLDLDDFKKVNDSLGHAVGDRLLVAAAERFRSCARATDTVGAVGRRRVRDPAGGSRGRGRTRRAWSSGSLTRWRRRSVLGGNEVHVHASIGIAVAAAAETADDLLRNADVAMYTAKRRGKGRSEIYRPDMHADDPRAARARGGAAHAIERDELALHYQPIVALRTGAVRGVEALRPLGPPASRLAAAGALHPAGRGDRAHRAPRARGSCARPAGRSPVWRRGRTPSSISPSP